MFKNFNAKVKYQLGKRIKSVRFNRGEYYGKFDGLREQHVGPLAMFLEKFGIAL